MMVSDFLEDIDNFLGAIETPVLDFWVSNPEWTALFELGGGRCTCYTFPDESSEGTSIGSDNCDFLKVSDFNGNL